MRRRGVSSLEAANLCLVASALQDHIVKNRGRSLNPPPVSRSPVSSAPPTRGSAHQAPPPVARGRLASSSSPSTRRGAAACASTGTGASTGHATRRGSGCGYGTSAAARGSCDNCKGNGVAMTSPPQKLPVTHARHETVANVITKSGADNVGTVVGLSGCDSEYVDDFEDGPPKPVSLAQQLGLIPQVQPPLSTVEWDKIECITRGRSVTNANEICSICREPYGVQVQVLLSCCHVFHRVCLQSYEFYSHSRVCPVCRCQQYHKKTIFDSIDQTYNQKATRIQAVWRGYSVRKWYRQLRKDKSLEEIREEFRREFVAGRLSQVTDRLLEDIDREREQLNREMADINRSVAQIRDFCSTVATTPSECDLKWKQCLCKAQNRAVADCSICLTALASRETSLLSCSHVFHTSCITSFEEYNTLPVDTCPVCRTVYTRRIYEQTNTS
ncbi:RING finger protein 32-like [Pelomyxa schiedti]|nr:RING finger protein 32-like [Pelomyxa schiedti]